MGAEEHYLSRLDDYPVPMHELATDGRIRLVNALECDLLGFRADEMIGRHVTDFIVSQERALAKQSISRVQAAKSGAPHRIRRTLLARDGREIPVEVYAMVLRDDQGQPAGIRTAIIDISRRMEPESIPREVLNAAMDGIAVMDMEGKVLEFNQAAERMLGYSREVALGAKLAGLIIPARLRAQHLAAIERYLKTGVHGPLAEGPAESTAMRSDGSEFPVELSITEIPRPDGLLFAGFMRDITARVAERKHLENLIEELYMERARRETVMSQLPGGVLVVDTEGGVMFTNDWMQRLLREAPPKPASSDDCGPLADWKRPDGTAYLARDWPPLRSLVEGTVIDREEMIFEPDRYSRIYLEVRSAPIRDRKGNVLASASVFFDVTRQRQAAAQLRASEEQYRAVFERDVAANLIFSRGLTVLACNQAAAVMFGFSGKEEMIAKSAAGEFPPQADRANMSAHIGREAPGPQVIRLRRWDQKSILAMATFTVRKDDAGNVVDIHGQLVDITDRRRAERKVVQLTGQLMNAQNEERRKLSHDLHDSTGQTLSALAMNLGLLESRWAGMPEAAAEVVAESKTLLQHCIRDIRTVSYSLHPPLLEELGVGAALRWYVEGFSKRSSIEVSLEVSSDFGRLSTEVETAIFRVVQESLTNVHRHSGSKTAQIRAWREPERVFITIADQGKGISPSTAREDTPSAGVGLASIRQQLALVNGNLQIQTGAGTTLTASVPVKTQRLNLAIYNKFSE